MITIGLISVGIILYVAMGAWVFGYVLCDIGDEDSWASPIPLLAAIFWPIVLCIILTNLITSPLKILGFEFRKTQLEKQKQRIAIQEKIRIELEEAAQELDEQLERETSATDILKTIRSQINQENRNHHKKELEQINKLK